MTHQLSANHFTLQSINFQSNPALNKDAKCSVLLIKANWCGHCRTFLPKFEKLSESFPNVNFLIVDEEQSRALLAYWNELVSPVFKANSFPTVVLYGKDGNPVRVVQRNKLKQILSTMI